MLHRAAEKAARNVDRSNTSGAFLAGRERVAYVLRVLVPRLSSGRGGLLPLIQRWESAVCVLCCGQTGDRTTHRQNERKENRTKREKEIKMEGRLKTTVKQLIGQSIKRCSEPKASFNRVVAMEYDVKNGKPKTVQPVFLQ